LYRIIPDAVVLEQMAAMPDKFLAGYAQLLDVLELEPWNGEPHGKNPDGAVRRWSFGPALDAFAVYLILDDQREVHILNIQWWG
jgi:hypothetical protein